MRLALAFLSGGLFGAGLFFSGMTDTRKVLGWLDFFGAWDITLAFVMGGAILPMFVAWRLTAQRAPLVGGHFPTPPADQITPRLAIGSVLFGIGWGLAGFCPGPAIVGLASGLSEPLIFVVALVAGSQLQRLLSKDA